MLKQTNRTGIISCHCPIKLLYRIESIDAFTIFVYFAVFPPSTTKREPVVKLDALPAR